MTDLMHYASSAALPVAVVLLVLAATARGVLWAQIDDPRWVKLARQYLDPLSTWSVVGFIVYALTLTAAGEAATAPLAIALVLAVAAAVLRVESDEAPAPAAGNAAPIRGGAAFTSSADAAPAPFATPARREAPPAPAAASPRAAPPVAPPPRGPRPASAHLFDAPGEPPAAGALWAREDRS